MKFGKVDLRDLNDVNFSLKKDFRKSQYQGEPGQAKIYLGGSEWRDRSWAGKIYPERCNPKYYLFNYGKNFNCVELNFTHYRIPKVEQVIQWIENVPPDFKFFPKLPQKISNIKDLGMSTDILARFADCASFFEDRLGMCFLQLPTHFDYSQYDVIEKWVKTVPSDLPMAIEFRHNSWYEWENFKYTMDLLKNHKISIVITDVAGHRDIIHSGIVNGKVFIRYVGNNLHRSDFSRINGWIRKLGVWIDKGVEEIYFFVHQPINFYAPEILHYTYEKMLEAEFNIERGPKLIGFPDEEFYEYEDEDYPEQLDPE